MLVCLAGIDGSGKSTQARLLARCLEAGGRTVRVTGVWDLLADPDLPARASLGALGLPGGTGARRGLREYLARLSSPARCLFVFHALVESFRRAQSTGAGLLLAVGYAPKYAAVEELLGTPRPVLQALESLLPRPDRTLWLDLDPAEAAARKPDPTPYECGGEAPGPESFARFQTRCRELLAARAAAEGWIRVEAGGDRDEVMDRLLAGLDPDQGTDRLLAGRDSSPRGSR